MYESVSKFPYAPAKTFQWIADEAEYTQVCGYLTIARLLMKKGDMAQRIYQQCDNRRTDKGTIDRRQYIKTMNGEQ